MFEADFVSPYFRTLSCIACSLHGMLALKFVYVLFTAPCWATQLRGGWKGFTRMMDVNSLLYILLVLYPCFPGFLLSLFLL